MDNKERFQRGCWVTLIVVMILLGFIGGAGAFRYVHEGGDGIFVAGGLASIANSIFAGITLYRKYLKSPKL